MPRVHSGPNSESEHFSRRSRTAGDSGHPGSSSPWISDITHMAADIIGLLAGMRDEARAGLKAKAGRAARHLDLPTRAEIETVRLMLARAREEQEAIKDRLHALERAIAVRGGGKPAASAGTASAAKSGKTVKAR